ncbi:MAG TPA: FUSC family protein, partial [Solirubrobacteraceae bacterium]|nr:FUSC family protein [Solirubrobacteraceae bacterium]
LPDRLAGWGMASGAALIAVGALWPTPARGPLRAAATAACTALAARLRAEVAYVLSGRDQALEHAHERAIEQAEASLAAMHRVFLATPYRPATLSTAGRATVRLVDELNWLGEIAAASAAARAAAPASHSACAVRTAAAEVLDRGADLLGLHGGGCAELHRAIDELDGALGRMEHDATTTLPIDAHVTDGTGAGEIRAGALVSSLDPSFRAQELGFAVTNIAQNIDLAAAAERRSWLQRLLGRQPRGIASTFSAAQERATAHVDRNSVWLHNSVRGAAGLALAVFIANETGVQHSFWVVLGTLSVLRSNALSTGQNIVRGLTGTVAGFVVGGALVALIGTNTTLLWFLLPPVVLLAGFAPAAISFAAGQAAFTMTLLFLYNIIQPVGWRVGLLRVEDIAIGCGVSLLVGLLFWPRGASAALRRALADAYRESAGYLASAVDFGMRRCDGGVASLQAPDEDAQHAAAAARRLDDTFRSYLAERGAKRAPLAQVTTLLSGAGGLRIAADAVLDLWKREDGSPSGDRTAAREEILRTTKLVEGWYEDLATSLLGGTPLREPLDRDEGADLRLIDAVRQDLRAEDGAATATAVRMIWTGDHLDAARRLQRIIVEPARLAAQASLAATRRGAPAAQAQAPAPVARD